VRNGFIPLIICTLTTSVLYPKFSFKGGKVKKLLAIVIITVLVSVLLAQDAVIEVQAQAETCPHTDGWVKIDGLSGLSYEYIAPEGKLVAESCYKAGSHDPVFATYNPALASVTIVSEVFNSPGGVVCTAPGVPRLGCAYQDLSHASFRLINDPGTETPPTETTTPPTETATPPTETATPPTETATPPTETATPPTETSTPPTETATPPTETTTPPTETPIKTITVTVTPPPKETETPMIEVEVNTGGNLLPFGISLVGLITVAGIQLIGRRKK